MPAGNEIVEAVKGAWAIARRDPQALDYFNLSIDGFWRSFFAAIILLPFWLVIILVERGLRDPEPAMGPFLRIETAAYAAEWIAFPVVMILVARLLRYEATYVPFIITYNWSSILVMAVLFPPLALYALGVLDQGTVAFLNLLAVGAALYYRWLVAHTVLGAPGSVAAGVVIIDFALGILINAGATAALPP